MQQKHAKEKSRRDRQLPSSSPVTEGETMSFKYTTKSRIGSTLEPSLEPNKRIVPFSRALGSEAGDSEQPDPFKEALLSVNPHFNLPAIQDLLYESLFGFKAVTLRQMLNITPAMSIRDALSPLAARSLAFVEQIITQRITDSNIQDEITVHRIVTYVAKQHTISAHVMAGYLRIDLVTGAAWAPEEDEEDDTEF